MATEKTTVDLTLGAPKTFARALRYFYILLQQELDADAAIGAVDGARFLPLQKCYSAGGPV